jgi:uncharacterized protein
MGRFAASPLLPVRTPSGDTLELYVAAGFARRLLGLAGMRSLDRRRGLAIPRCSSVHTFGMRFTIDVVFVERDPGVDCATVLELRERVPPLRVARLDVRGKRARRHIWALELRAGESRRLGITPGTKLRVAQPAESNRPD